MNKAFSDKMNQDLPPQKGEGKGHSRLLAVLVYILIACVLVIGGLAAWLISLYHAPYVTGDRDLDREIAVCLSECYDDYQVAGLVNATHDNNNVANCCLVETDEGLHLGALTLDLFTSEHLLTYDEIVKDMEIGVAYEAEDGAMAHSITCSIYDRREDVPADALQTNKISTSRGDVYFSILKITEIARK